MLYTLRTEVPVRFKPVGFEDFEVAYPTLEIEFAYAPGRPAYTPRGEYAPIDPPDPAEVDYRGVKLIDGDGLDPRDMATVEGWAQDYLDSDEGYNAACRYAEDNSGPDPDAWYDAKRNGDFD